MNVTIAAQDIESDLVPLEISKNILRIRFPLNKQNIRKT